jgi:hypothetical protein
VDVGEHHLVRISHYYQVIILTFVVFLSRVPFLGDGFGTNPDGWRVADAARIIALSGHYSYSRPPGHPFQELFYSLIWDASPTMFNLITAMLSVGVFIFFYLSLAKLNFKKSLLGALALVFIPVVYINSTNSMDFIWALFFILGSFYFALDLKLALAGIFLGLAIGCRITSAAMMIPIGLLFHMCWKTDIAQLHPHTCWHTFAVRYLIHGGDAFSLEEILGHTSGEMTRRYVNLASEDVKEKYRRFSPMDNLGFRVKGKGRPGAGFHPPRCAPGVR